MKSINSTRTSSVLRSVLFIWNNPVQFIFIASLEIIENHEIIKKNFCSLIDFEQWFFKYINLQRRNKFHWRMKRPAKKRQPVCFYSIDKLLQRIVRCGVQRPFSHNGSTILIIYTISIFLITATNTSRKREQSWCWRPFSQICYYALLNNENQTIDSNFPSVSLLYL